MKKLMLLLMVLGFASASVLIRAESAAQGSTVTAKVKAVKKRKKTVKVSAAKFHWVCPMHDTPPSDHPGKCPVCGMDLVKEEKK